MALSYTFITFIWLLPFLYRAQRYANAMPDSRLQLCVKETQLLALFLLNREFVDGCAAYLGGVQKNEYKTVPVQ